MVSEEPAAGRAPRVRRRAFFVLVIGHWSLVKRGRSIVNQSDAHAARPPPCLRVPFLRSRRPGSGEQMIFATPRWRMMGNMPRKFRRKWLPLQHSRPGASTRISANWRGAFQKSEALEVCRRAARRCSLLAPDGRCLAAIARADPAGGPPEGFTDVARKPGKRGASSTRSSKEWTSLRREPRA
jgi:hypothetical protein